MRKLGWAALCAAGVLALAGHAGATTYYDVTLTGYLTFQGAGPDDANLHVGQSLTLTARFSDAYVVQNFGGFGYNAAGSWANRHPLPVTGAEFWRIDGGGLTWAATGDELDGTAPWYRLQYSPGNLGQSRELAGPGIAFENGKVVAFGSDLDFYPANSSAPAIGLAQFGYGFDEFTCTDYPACVAPYAHTSNYTEASFSPNFRIYDPMNYTNYRYTPGFNGVWDFASSCVITEGVGPQTCSVVGVPEPATWAMMLVGFFGLGTALRRRAGPGAGKRSRARSLRLVDHDQQEARPQGLLLNLRHG